MYELIKKHNYLNGNSFVLFEFSIIFLIIVGFGAYNLNHGHLFIGLISLGIISNCLVVMFIALQSLIGKERGVSFMHININPIRVVESKKENPAMNKETLILLICILVPFLVLLSIFVEVVFGNLL